MKASQTTSKQLEYKTIQISLEGCKSYMNKNNYQTIIGEK